MRDCGDYLWQEIVRCFLSHAINRSNKQSVVHNVVPDLVESEICLFISQVAGISEPQAKQEYYILFDNAKKMTTVAGTVPLVLQICSGIGFLAGIINGIIMFTTAFHLTFVLLFAVSILVACTPLFYRNNHKLEYKIVAALQGRLYSGCNVYSLLEDVYKEIQQE